MVKATTVAACTTIGSVAVLYTRILGFQSGLFTFGSNIVGVSRSRIRRGPFTGTTPSAKIEEQPPSFSPLPSLAASIAGAALLSAVSVKCSVARYGYNAGHSTNGAGKSTTVAMRQSFRSEGAGATCEVGQTVEVKIWSGEWRPGIVTSTTPLLIRPKDWTSSHSFPDVRVARGVPISSYNAFETPRASAMPRPNAGYFDPAEQLGVTEPLGFFDPLGITAMTDESGFRHLRAAEIKHGRIAMLAAVGCVGQHFIAIPGFEDVPRGLGALDCEPANPYGLFFVALVSGYVELLVWKQDDNSLPGDFGNPWCPIDDMVVDDDLRNKEINNGRFAMIAMMGIIAAEVATGLDGVEQIFGPATFDN